MKRKSIHENSKGVFQLIIEKNATNLVSRILFLHYHLSAMNITVPPVAAYPSCQRKTLISEQLTLYRAGYTWHYST